jgi:hypothetical protein
MKTVVDYGTQGGAGKSLISLGAIAEHAGMARQAYTAMNNYDTPALNSIANSLGVAVGKNPKTTYNAIATILADENDKFFSGNRSSVEGRAKYEKLYASNASPDQAGGVFDQVEQAVIGRIRGYDQPYFNATHKHLTETGLLPQPAIDLINKYPEAGSVNKAKSTPGATPAAIPTQDDLMKAFGK